MKTVMYQQLKILLQMIVLLIIAGGIKTPVLYNQRKNGENTRMKSIRNRYSSQILDEILCYFMKTILQLQNNGIVNLPLRNSFTEPIRYYIELAIELIMDAQPVEISELILEAEYDVILERGGVDAKTVLSLQMIKELSKHIHYDEDYYEYILSTSNLWGNKVSEYASRTFYPNLPDEVKEKYGINDLIKYVPQEMFRLGDY